MKMRPPREVGAGLFVIIFGVILKACGQQANICSPKACQKSDNQKVVCGSDGLSYPNRCQLERVRCQNKNVTFVKRGSCKRQRSCLEWEDLSLDFPQYRFKARCKKNGSYEPGQCHPETGYCWCVTPEGIPLSDTVKQKNKTPGSKPIRCGGNKKKIPRSPRKSKNRVCKLLDKSHLNNNLINSFHSEYHREFGQNGSDHIVITWKFSSLDLNHDQTLDRREYRDIKRLVSKAMKPKKCARMFPKSCDVDSDGRITLQEWGDCFSRDGYTVATDGAKSTGDGQDSGDDGDDYDSPYDPMPAPPHGVLNPDSSIVPSLNTNYDDETVETREEESTGCLGDRKTALEEGNIAGYLHDATYIPECTPDGRYKKVQCYKSVGYCWCVNEDNGQNIPGTSVKGQYPNCDLLKPPPKPMKGCPDDKKLVFLKDLMQFLHSKMSDSVTPNNPAGSIALIQEQALWSFNFLDKNKNKVLEKSEWKAFKEMVTPVKGLRKCGKKLPRYCDSNKDKEISTTEWLDCLNVQSLMSQTNVPKLPRSGKTNPLSLLKDD